MKIFNRKSIFFLLFVTINFYFFAETFYKVEKGDTLYSISRKYQLTVAELRAANNFSESDVLKAGQKLIIPEADIANAVALSSSATSNSTIKTTEYVVQKGDTLYRIAKNNGLTVAQLLAINNFDSSTVIKAGQKIKVAAGGSSNSLAKTSSNSSNTSEETRTSTSSTNSSNSSLSSSTREEKTPDTRSYGSTLTADSSIKWPVSNPKITQVKGKVWGVQLSALANEAVRCIAEGTAMYVGVYRGFGQVVFVQSKTGLIYAYTGLGNVKIKKGDYILSGSEIGRVGIDSITEKPQMTFMVFQNGQPIDPSKAPRN